MTTRVEGINWTAEWQRRSEAAKAAKQAGRVPYDREADPLLALDLREVWEPLTGESLRGTLGRCPSPDHDDDVASCAVRERLFFCNGCPTRGSIIDLGALLYDLEPRGRGFFEIRNRLLAELGMEA